MPATPATVPRANEVGRNTPRSAGSWSSIGRAILRAILASLLTTTAMATFLLNFVAGRVEFEANVSENPGKFEDVSGFDYELDAKISHSVFSLIASAQQGTLIQPGFANSYNEMIEAEVIYLRPISSVVRRFANMSPYERSRIYATKIIEPLRDCFDILEKRSAARGYPNLIYGVTALHRGTKAGSETLQEKDFVAYREAASAEFRICARLIPGMRRYIASRFPGPGYDEFIAQYHAGSSVWINDVRKITEQLKSAVAAARNSNRDGYYAGLERLREINLEIREYVDTLANFCRTLSPDQVDAQIQKIGRVELSRSTIINIMQSYYQPPESITINSIILAFAILFGINLASWLGAATGVDALTAAIGHLRGG